MSAIEKVMKISSSNETLWWTKPEEGQEPRGTCSQHLLAAQFYSFRTGNFIFHPQTRFFLSDFISCNRSVDVGTHSRGRRRAEFAAARTCCSRAANWCPVSVRCQQPPRTVLSRLCSQAQSVDDTLMVSSLTLRHSSATIGRVIYTFF